MNIQPGTARFLAVSALALLLAACAQPPAERDTRDMPAVKESRTHGEGRTALDPYGTATGPVPVAGYVQPWPAESLSRETYAHHNDNPVRLATETPVSTFSVDVDTGSYANVRRWLTEGRLPPMDAVRVEEMINYFDYAYPAPESRIQPFSVNTAVVPAPWNADALLLRIGIKGYEIEAAQRPAANLVFLVDVSGSMQSPYKLGLLKQGLGMLVNNLDEDDRVSLVVYAGASGVVLEPTPGNRKATIRSALAQLVARGSTNGAAGIRLAYDMAKQAYIKDGINRVVLATDGDFNVGTVNFEELVDLVERARESGVTLTTLGFGGGNYNDRLMEQLADKGNGNYGYIDTLKEARKLLVEELSGTLTVIASDVKAQIEFNPAVVAEYRLIGYENRVLNREDFNNDTVDAGDVGAGHAVTALYEVVLADSSARRIDDLRYADRKPVAQAGAELAFLKLRYKLPGETESRLITHPVDNDVQPFSDSDADFRFAAAVAAYGQELRGGKYLGDFDYADIHALAANARGDDPNGYRGEFLQLVGLARTLAEPAETIDGSGDGPALE